MQDMSEEEAQGSVVLYFHTKGMVHHGRNTSRPVVESIVFNQTIVPWRKVLGILSSNATVTRVDAYPALAGFIWQNFFWARASYIQLVVEPIRTTQRQYYEDWLGRLYDAGTNTDAEIGRITNGDTCYSINGACSGHQVFYGFGTWKVCAEKSI